MKLQKLTINNFSSYYGKKEFVFSQHMNLILGSNGDGKTTFFEALNWVLTPDYAAKTEDEELPEDASLVSAKMFSELEVGQQGKVVVTVELLNNDNKLRIIERSFNVLKKPDGRMKIEGRSHKAYQQVGMKRKEFFSVKDVLEKENVFPAIIKKYHLFKGEDKLNIFDDKSTFQALIDMFSDVRDFGPYKAFAGFGQNRLKEKVEKVKKTEGKLIATIAEAQRNVVDLSKQIDNAEVELAKAKKENKEASEKKEAIGNDFQILQEIDKKKNKINPLENEIERFASKIDERFNVRLLDSQWILMGFKPILQEFNRKLESVKESKDNIETDYRKKQEEEISKTNIEQAKTELEKIAWRQSDVERMKVMMHSHRCIYCGSEAPEGSIAYDFIKQRIQDVIKLLTPRPQENRPEIKRFFKGRNIEALKEMGASLTYTGKDIEGIQDEIEGIKRNNDERRAEISGRQQQIEKLKKEIETLNAMLKSDESQREGNIIQKYNQWNEQEVETKLKMRSLPKQIAALKDQLKKARTEQEKTAKGTAIAPLLRVDDFFRLFGNAIENIEEDAYTQLLSQLVKDANLYLSRLNVDDFTGTIKIERNLHDELEPILSDKSGQEITNPNTSLRTTMHISLLLAIAEMTSGNRDAEYPLIFDAPTSSFDEGKDKSFYECMNAQVDRQCIVVTKSYLYKDVNGEFVVDKKALDRLNCKKYRIRKKTGFDKLDITTIDTEVEEIKED